VLRYDNVFRVLIVQFESYKLLLLLLRCRTIGPRIPG
jgi:hypothetical protein